MPSETELTDLLESIADRAPSVESTLNRRASTSSPSPVGRPHRRWLPVAATVAAVAATVLVSVTLRGSEAHRGAPAGNSADARPTVDHAFYALPLDAYYASAAQQRTLERAEFALMQRCAQAHGVAVRDATFAAPDPAPGFLSDLANNIRPLTVQQAGSIGYDLYASGTSAIDTATAGLTPHQLEIVDGWGYGKQIAGPSDKFLFDGGCLGQADRTLLEHATPARQPGVTSTNGQPGLFDDDVTILNSYVLQARTAETAPAVRAAQARWSTCMATHGYPGLHSTATAIQGTANLRSASAKREARQDVSCKQSTGFMTVWIASVTKAQKAVIAANRAQLAPFEKRLAARMANAASALSQPAPATGPH